MSRYKVWCVLVLLATHSVLLAWNAYVHSPVVNEVGHLPAGISHLRFKQFDLYRVNPPLPRMVAALPVLLANPSTDWTHYDTDPTERNETSVDIDFVNANGPRTFFLYALGRWMCIPFSLIGAWTSYRFAGELFGGLAGLAAMGLWCFCPNILGHGSLIMPDVPCAALGVAACYAFWRWLRQPTWALALIAGTVLGLAELTKTTLIIFYPLWPVLWITYRWPVRLREFGMLVVQLALSFYIINLGYAFEGTGQRLRDFHFQSRMLAGAASKGHPNNRFAATLLAYLPVPLPKNYVQGIDTQRVDFEHGLRSYLRGQWSDHGWWYYYLYALAIKVPLGTWTLVVLAAGIACYQPIGWRDEVFLLAPAAAVLLLISSQTGFSVHFRYALPVLPFLFIWASRSTQWLNGNRTTWALVRQIAVAGSLVWSITSSLSYFPHSLSYFNESVGGPLNGPDHLLDSNVSWGQDLLNLRSWYETHSESRPLHLVMFGLVNPRLAGIEFSLPSPGMPKPGWYIIDVNHIHGSTQPIMGNDGHLTFLSDYGSDLTVFKRFSAGGQNWVLTVRLSHH